jgi:hypothetical protein
VATPHQRADQYKGFQYTWNAVAASIFKCASGLRFLPVMVFRGGRVNPHVGVCEAIEVHDQVVL